MNGASWIPARLEDDQTLPIKGTFYLKHKHLVEVVSPSEGDEWDSDEPETVSFQVATLDGDYFVFDREILAIDCDLLIHKDVQLTYKSFTAEKRVSIFRIIAALKPGRIVIGGDMPDSIPEQDFASLVSNFPRDRELKRYVLARVSSVVRDFVDTKVDAEHLFRSYVNKRLKKKTKDIVGLFRQDEIRKYKFLHEKLTEMLKAESGYNEAAWQTEILQIILLLNPKYIKALRGAPVRDTYRNVNRQIDILLVDASGNVDIVEIKQPFDKCIVTNNQYRDNFIPLRELSGTVMQVEKYVFYLNKWGRAGETSLTEKYKAELPEDFSIKITNPGGLIIMGRDNNLGHDQRQDFEVVKRKYKNVIDIITYDDLLRRLEFIIKQLDADT
jgi:hypothetical protein